MEEAKKLAREKGDKSDAQRLASILEGYSHAPHSEDNHGLAAVGAEGAPGGEHVDSHVHTQVQP